MRARRAIAFFLMMLCTAAGAEAHPLGNFTINHLAKVTATARALHVRYVLDIAEIPAFQIVQTHGGTWNTVTLAQWASDELPLVQAGLHVSVDSAPLALQARTAHASVRPGAGGLPILRWVGEFSASLSSGPHNIRLSDNVYADRRIGWKDLIAGTQTEPTNELRAYPNALLGSPRRISALSFDVQQGRISGIVRSEDAAPVIASSSGWFSPALLSEMFSRPSQTPLFVLLTILAAFALGTLHAVEPGHGKALLAFTLVGARATPKQALVLASSLTVAHTIGVFALGAVLFFATGFVSESIYPWITLVSGAVIAVIGARTLARFVHSRAHASGHHHEHAHDHHHGDGGHGHSHAVAGSQPLNFGSAVWAAMSGGIAPCPAAIVVLLAALRLHHLPYGMLLIVVFSMGLASVLSGLGLGVVRGAAWLSQRSGYARFAAFGPLLTACVISVIGSVMLAQGMTQEGVSASVPLLVLIALAAITGYALAQRGHHHHAHLQTEGGRA